MYMGIKERRTKILLAIFLLADSINDGIIIDEKVQQTFDLNLNPKVKATLLKMVQEDIIEKISSENKFPCYKLTNNGFYELALQFPFIRFLKDNWDGKWRILSYEIPESKRDLRDKLRREVTGWGLGPWHRSFWLTPHPIIENLKALVSKKEEEKYIQAFESAYVFGDQKILIEKVWNKSALENKYRELFKIWHSILSKDTDKLHKLTLVVTEYVKILRQDPGLPKELISDKWIGFEARNIFTEIKNILIS